MGRTVVANTWNTAAPGWAKWESTIAAWMEPATNAMLKMARVTSNSHVLDLACGAGSQTLSAARLVGPAGQVVAADISEKMLRYVQDNVRRAQLENVTTMLGPAEELDLPADSFDAVICRLGLMLFASPARALRAVRHALKPGGRVASVVFTVPAANPFMVKPMQILLRHAGKEPPPPGKPGIFALGAPGVLERLLDESGFVNIEQRTVAVPLRMPSATETLELMQEAFGAYRAVVRDSPPAVRDAAWAEVADMFKIFETANGFEGPSEVLIAVGTKPAR